MTSYTIDSYQIYIKSSFITIISPNNKIYKLELDDADNIFSNKDIIIEENNNILIINIDYRKIYIPEVINEFDFRDIQIAEMKKMIIEMNKKIKKLENELSIIKNKVNVDSSDNKSDYNDNSDNTDDPSNKSDIIDIEGLSLFQKYNFYKNTFTSYHCINVYYPLIKDMKEYSNNFYRISANFNDNKDIILDYEFRFVNSLNGLENCKNIEHLQIIKQSKPDIFNSSVCNCNTIGKNINYLKTLNKLSLCCICNKDTELFNYKINDTIKTIEFIDCNNHLTDISFLKYFTSLDKIIIIDSYISSNISSFDFLLDINKKINIEIGYNGYDSSDKPWRITPIDNHNEILALQHKKNIYDKYIK